MPNPAPDCRSSRCRHRGDCGRNPARPVAPAGEEERPRCFEPARAETASPMPLGRTAD